eukprot:scaffold11791_cov75-Cylindrotheca_fusiformis.AAC.2
MAVPFSSITEICKENAIYTARLNAIAESYAMVIVIRTSITASHHQQNQQNSCDLTASQEYNTFMHGCNEKCSSPHHIRTINPFAQFT